MNYWVFKANPDGYTYKDHLRPDGEENWYSRYAPKDAKIGDRVFLWESGGKSRVVGLAEVMRERTESKNDGPVVRLRYLTHQLEVTPRIAEMKQVAALRAASFLRGGPIRTAYPLTRSEAVALHGLVIAANPDVQVWPGVGRVPALRDADEGVNEGQQKLVTHVRVERAAGLSRKKKTAFQNRHGRLFCEACGKDYAEYGELKDSVFEAHHRRALSKTGKTNTKLADLAVVCSCCHRAIHRTDPMLSVERFAAQLRHRRTK